jgi:hypothetical protein
LDEGDYSPEMNMRRTGPFSLCIRVLAFALLTATLASAFAQTALPTKDSKEEQEKLQKGPEGKALKLLDSTLVDAQMLKLVENQTLFQSVAADLVQTTWRSKRPVRQAQMVSLDGSQSSGSDGSIWQTCSVRF